MSGHFQAVVDHVMSDDDSELGKTKAELAYALMSLEREIAIAQQAQAQNATLIEALRRVLDLTDGDRPTVNEQNAFEHFQRTNKTMIDIREIAREALVECPRPVGHMLESPDA